MSRPDPSGRGERGAVLPIVALFLVVLLGFTALSIDIGDTMLHKRRLQAAVDLSALAASQKLPNAGDANAAARSMAARNWATRDTSELTASVTTGCKVAGCAAPDKVTVEASAEVPTTFARVLGVDALTVRARAAACGPCETSTRKFDVMVVLDRSYSMCVNSAGAYNGCYDLNQAKAAIKSLLGFFDPRHDRVGLAALSSGDSRPPHDSVGTFPCDTTATTSYSGDKRFLGTLGDFMDGTPADHDSWVLAPLAADFKNPDGTLDPASALVSTVDCLKYKGWTPIAPAVQAAAQELAANGRAGDPDVDQIMVVLGDGGANVQPMQRDAAGRGTTVRSWYTPSPGNDFQPCHDAVGQAAAAKAAGIDIYTIAYDIDATGANLCYSNNQTNVPAYVESGTDARKTLVGMASDAKHFYEKPDPGELTSIFNAIGRQIVKGGSRLVE